MNNVKSIDFIRPKRTNSPALRQSSNVPVKKSIYISTPDDEPSIARKRTLNDRFQGHSRKISISDSDSKRPNSPVLASNSFPRPQAAPDKITRSELPQMRAPKKRNISAPDPLLGMKKSSTVRKAEAMHRDQNPVLEDLKTISSEPKYSKPAPKPRVSGKLSPLRTFKKNIARQKNEEELRLKQKKSPFLESVQVEKRPLGEDVPIKNIYEEPLPEALPEKRADYKEKPAKSKVIKATKPKSGNDGLPIGVVIFLTVLIGIATGIGVYFLLSN